MNKLLYYINNYVEIKDKATGETHLVLERCPDIEILKVEVIDFTDEW